MCLRFAGRGATGCALWLGYQGCCGFEANERAGDFLCSCRILLRSAVDAVARHASISAGVARRTVRSSAPMQSGSPAVPTDACHAIGARSAIRCEATLERKRAALSIPTAVDHRMSADGVEAPVRAETASEVIRNMRRSRGQAAV
jgi:hypothetical protein